MPNIFRDVHRIFDIKIGILEQIDHHAWLDENGLDELTFLRAFEMFVVETEKADAVWLREQFEVRGGVDEGLLWSALLKPALIGEILTNFSRPALFLKWVEKKSDPDRTFGF